MMTRRIAKCLAGIVGGVAISGCASWFEAAPPPVNVQIEPVAEQLVAKMPSLRAQRFSPLLDFEADTDGVFVAMQPAGRMVWDRSHTGKRSLLIPPGSQRVAVKLSSVLSGREFPGEWTLVGAFFYCDDPVEITVGIEGDDGATVSPRRVQLTPSQWSVALVDLSNIARSEKANISGNTTLVITFPRNTSPTAPAVWCDDVLLINNTRSIIAGGTAAGASGSSTESAYNPATTATADVSEEYTATRVGNAAPVVIPKNGNTNTNTPEQADAPSWSIEQRGLSFIGQRPGKFNFKLITADASRNGWRIEEANAVRARFSSDGREKSLVVYSDGRSYLDGQFRPMSAEVRDDPGCADPHTSPPEVQVPQELGRVNRNTAGDANNDGYNESRGAHQIATSGARLEMKIVPHTSSITRPVFEITGLAEGDVLVTIEGRLVQSGLRLADGTLLLELPVRIDRPTTVNVRVQ